jgi:hypothetical protein
MRKYRYFAVVAGVALVMSVSAGAAVAASSHKAPKPVLTAGKIGGTAVKRGAVLEASLPKGGSVTFTLTANGQTGSVACTSSSIEATVLRNPVKAGEATLSVKSVAVSNCGTVDGVTLSLAPLNLPYGATIKAAKGNPVTLSEASKSKPMGLVATITEDSVEATCVFTAASFSGHASNKGNVVGFSKQELTLDPDLSAAICTTLAHITSATFTATYGPIVDSNLKHSPKVFIS